MARQLSNSGRRSSYYRKAFSDLKNTICPIASSQKETKFAIVYTTTGTHTGPLAASRQPAPESVQAIGCVRVLRTRLIFRDVFMAFDEPLGCSSKLAVMKM